MKVVVNLEVSQRRVVEGLTKAESQWPDDKNERMDEKELASIENTLQVRL